MKKFILLSMTAALSLYTQCTEEKGLEYKNPEGKLAKTEIFTSLDAEKPERYVVYKYDQYGNLIEQEIYDYPDQKWAFTRYEYDDKQRMHIERPFVIRNGAPSSNGYLEYLYDDQDRVIKIRGLVNGHAEGDERRLYYDNDGRKIKEEEYILSRDRIQTIDSFFYELEDKLIKEVGYGFDDSEQRYVLNFNFVFTYDEQGNLKQKAMADGLRNTANDFVQGIVMEYTYNDATQLIESRRYDPYWGYTLVEKKVYEYY